MVWTSINRPLRVFAGVVAVTLAVSTAPALAETVTPASGTLPDGGTWVADVPSNWNGTLIIYSHGLTVNDPSDAQPGLKTPLLNLGYAMAGSSYDPTGPLWAFNSAVNDQFETIAAVENSVLPSKPTSVIAMGLSMGGLVTALLDQDSDGRINGSFDVCGLNTGGEAFENYTLDGSYAVNTLLNTGAPIQLTGYPTEAASETAGNELMTVAQAAQTTAAGRARLALAMAFYNTTTWTATNVGGISTNPSVTPPLFPPPLGDYSEWEDEQYETQFAPGADPTIYGEENRWTIEQASGGQPAWTAGVNFQTELDNSPYYKEVSSLYTAAGLNLNADLATLTADADITSDPSALETLIDTSVPTGTLQVPELDLHNIADEIVPVQQENYYAQVVAAAGDSDMLGQAYIYSPGHCHFSVGEEIAALQTLQQRITAGSWGTLLEPSTLNAATRALDEGGSAFVGYSPPPLTGTNLSLDAGPVGDPIAGRTIDTGASQR